MNAEWRMTHSRSREKSLCELDLNTHLYLTLNCGMLQNTWNIVHENFIVFYNVFVAFVGLNNNTYAQYRIWIGLVWPIPDPAENASIGAIPILNIGSAHP